VTSELAESREEGVEVEASESNERGDPAEVGEVWALE